METVPTAEPVEVLTPGKPAMRRRLPFAIGQRVKHVCEISPTGVVGTISVYPGCVGVHVSWELGSDKWVPAVALEAADDERPESAYIAMPYPFGHEVRHRADKKSGIITGYQVAEYGMMVQVAWGSSQDDWHELCELEA